MSRGKELTIVMILKKVQTFTLFSLTPKFLSPLRRRSMKTPKKMICFIIDQIFSRGLSTNCLLSS